MLVVAFALLAGVLPVSPQAAGASEPVDVIVREAVPATDDAENTVRALGGTVGRQIDVIGGFTASVPASAVQTLTASDAVLAATLDGTLVARSGSVWQGFEYKSEKYAGSMMNTAEMVGIDGYWRGGYTGEGVGVALIDTGVANVPALSQSGKVINGPDFSLDAMVGELPHIDLNGHGTHMAGIIAGRDPKREKIENIGDGESYFLGMAPDAHIINVKVGASDGTVDVSQVLAAIDWVVAHKDDPGMNIRVLNLSFGTDSTQDPLLDPVSYAVDRAWQAGIFVVVAAGNDGNASSLRNPAGNANVLAVGAVDPRASNPVPAWSSCGTDRTVDITAPGASILSLRAPGSVADRNQTAARVGDQYFIGSGTSQAAAVTSGVVALILDRNPEYRPDEVKALLMGTANPVRGASGRCQGAGLIDVSQAMNRSTVGAAQDNDVATGLGSIEASRGSFHVQLGDNVIKGEIDLTGAEWEPKVWIEALRSGEAWSGGSWSGGSWSGGSWSGGSWSGGSWSGGSWSGGSWSGGSWSHSTWSTAQWAG